MVVAGEGKDEVCTVVERRAGVYSLRLLSDGSMIDGQRRAGLVLLQAAPGPSAASSTAGPPPTEPAPAGRAATHTADAGVPPPGLTELVRVLDAEEVGAPGVAPATANPTDLELVRIVDASSEPVPILEAEPVASTRQSQPGDAGSGGSLVAPLAPPLAERVLAERAKFCADVVGSAERAEFCATMPEHAALLGSAEATDALTERAEFCATLQEGGAPGDLGCHATGAEFCIGTDAPSDLGSGAAGAHTERVEFCASKVSPSAVGSAGAANALTGRAEFCATVPELSACWSGSASALTERAECCASVPEGELPSDLWSAGVDGSLTEAVVLGQPPVHAAAGSAAEDEAEEEEGMAANVVAEEEEEEEELPVILDAVEGEEQEEKEEGLPVVLDAMVVEEDEDEEGLPVVLDAVVGKEEEEDEEGLPVVLDAVVGKKEEEEEELSVVLVGAPLDTTDDGTNTSSADTHRDLTQVRVEDVYRKNLCLFVYMYIYIYIYIYLYKQICIFIHIYHSIYAVWLQRFPCPRREIRTFTKFSLL